MWCNLKKISNKIIEDIELTNEQIIALSKRWDIDELLKVKHNDTTKLSADVIFKSLDALHQNIISMIEKAHSAPLDDITKMIKLKEHKINFEDQFKDLIKKSPNITKLDYKFAYENIQSYLNAMIDSHAFKKLANEFKRTNMSYKNIDDYLNNEILILTWKSKDFTALEKYAIYEMKQNYYKKLFEVDDIRFLEVNQKDMLDKKSTTIFKTTNRFEKVNTTKDAWGLPERIKDILTNKTASKKYIVNDLADHSWWKNYSTLTMKDDQYVLMSDILYWKKVLDEDVQYFIWQWSQYTLFDSEWGHVIFRNNYSRIDNNQVNNQAIANYLDSKNVIELDLNISMWDEWIELSHWKAYWLERLFLENWMYKITKENNVTNYIQLANQNESIYFWNFRFENKLNQLKDWLSWGMESLLNSKKYVDNNYKSIQNLFINLDIKQSDEIPFWKVINSTFLISDLANKYISVLEKVLWRDEYSQLLRKNINLNESLASVNAFKSVQHGLLQRANSRANLTDALLFESKNKDYLEGMSNLEIADRIKRIYLDFNWVAKTTELEAYIINVISKDIAHPYDSLSKLPIYIREKFIPSMDKALFNQVFSNLLDQAWVTKEIFNKELFNIKWEILNTYYIWKNKDWKIRQALWKVTSNAYENKAHKFTIDELNNFKAFTNDWWANKVMIYDFFIELKRANIIDEWIDVIKLTESMDWMDKWKLINTFQRLWKEELFSNINKEFKVTELLSNIIKKNKLKSEATLMWADWLSKWEALEASLMLANDNKDIIIDFITENLWEIKILFKNSINNIVRNLDITAITKYETKVSELDNIFKMLPFNYKTALFSKASKNEMWKILIDDKYYKWMNPYFKSQDIWQFFENFEKGFNELSMFNYLDSVSKKDLSLNQFREAFKWTDSYFKIWTTEYKIENLFNKNWANIELYELFSKIVDKVTTIRWSSNIEWALKQWDRIDDFNIFTFNIDWYPRNYTENNILDHPLFWLIRKIYWIDRTKDLNILDMYLETIKKNLNIPLFETWLNKINKAKVKLRKSIHRYNDLFIKQTRTDFKKDPSKLLSSRTKKTLKNIFEWAEWNEQILKVIKFWELQEFTPIIETYKWWNYSLRVLDRTWISEFEWWYIKNEEIYFWEVSWESPSSIYDWYWEASLDWISVKEFNPDYVREITIWDLDELPEWLEFMFKVKNKFWKNKFVWVRYDKKWFTIWEYNATTWKELKVETYDEIGRKIDDIDVNRASKELDKGCPLI